MTNGFETGGSGPGGFGPGDYDKLVRQYWNNWGEMMRKTAAAAPAGMPGMSGAAPGMGAFPGIPGFDGSASPPIPGWNEALAWWSQMANDNGNGAMDAGFKDAVDQFNGVARSWFTLMQQVASQIAPGADAGDIAQAWQRALGSLGDNPFADMFRTMRGPGQQGFDSWLEQASPYLQNFVPWQGDSKSTLGQPTFGFTREHQQRWQKLNQASFDYQQHSQGYNALMAEAAQNAFKLFEQKLRERSEPGRQLDSTRALFDLWIEAAEEAYAVIALSPRFREAYGSMVNAQMRLRAGLQREVEEVCELFGMPTRTEVDSAHRKLVQVERELRRIRDALEAVGGLEALAVRGAASGKPMRSSSAKSAATKQPGARSTRASTGSKVAAPAKSSRRVVAKAAPASPAIAEPDRAVATMSAAPSTAVKKAAVKKPAAKKASPKKPAANKQAKKKAAQKNVPVRKAAATRAPASKAATKTATRKTKATKTPSGSVRVNKIPADKAVKRRTIGRKSRPVAAQTSTGAKSGSWADRARATTLTADSSPPAPVLKRPSRVARKRISA
ncbi:MAG: class III poly(R)-hydroxyalkanoic acid synthase subunit PhaE [Pseudomonadota bacterium]|nr:class III poly(R)-hydroxyalkanoic acid synthase subunit PhaE [Pseudomonadota bacterium]